MYHESQPSHSPFGRNKILNTEKCIKNIKVFAIFEPPQRYGVIKKLQKKIERNPHVLSLIRRKNCAPTTPHLGAIIFFIRNNLLHLKFFLVFF